MAPFEAGPHRPAPQGGSPFRLGRGQNEAIWVAASDVDSKCMAQERMHSGRRDPRFAPTPACANHPLLVDSSALESQHRLRKTTPWWIGRHLGPTSEISGLCSTHAWRRVHRVLPTNPRAPVVATFFFFFFLRQTQGRPVCDDPRRFRPKRFTAGAGKTSRTPEEFR